MANKTELPIQLPAHIVELVKAKKTIVDELTLAADTAHAALWDAVHAEYPDLKREDNHTLNTQYMDQGVVMLEDDDDDCGCGQMPDSLKQMLMGIVSDLREKQAAKDDTHEVSGKVH